MVISPHPFTIFVQVVANSGDEAKRLHVHPRTQQQRHAHCSHDTRRGHVTPAQVRDAVCPLTALGSAERREMRAGRLGGLEAGDGKVGG